MTDKQSLTVNILLALMNTPNYSPQIDDEDVIENGSGQLIKKKKDHYIVAKKGQQGTRYSISNPERTFVKTAAKFADEILKV